MALKTIKTPRDFPAVEALLQAKELKDAIASVPRPVAATVVKEVVARLKKNLRSGGQPLTYRSLLSSIGVALIIEAGKRLQRVINATGIVVHTNLGRAPLSAAMLEPGILAATGYGSVEFDVFSGKRGSRGQACEDYLKHLTGVEASTVVNNNAAALFLILNTLSNRKKVLLSRGELVQIGGGFRVPDILRRSGAKLVEVGSTNVTTVADYREALDDKVGLILKVHKSNFVQSGFTDEVSIKALVALGKQRGVPVVNDLGSGVLIPTRKILGYHEPSVQESVRAGAALTCFSGDKMLGGVQAGLIVGQSELIGKIKKNPIFRTMRIDKIVFAILERLLAAYLDGHQATAIKLWEILGTKPEVLRRRAETVLKDAGAPHGVTVEKTAAYVGGGAMPEQTLKSYGLIFSSIFDSRRLAEILRLMTPPIVGRIEADRLILDLKAVDETDLANLTKAIKQVAR